MGALRLAAGLRCGSLHARLPLLALLLGACVQAPSSGFDPAATQVALQRMRFAVEAVCLNNTTRAAQERAIRALGFPERDEQGDVTFFVNPATLTFVQLVRRSPDLGFVEPDGTRRVVRGPACGVGSPAVDVAQANRLVGEILAPRLVEGDRTVARPVAVGENADRGFGFLFEGLAMTVLRVGDVTFTDGAGRAQRFVYPVILVVRDR